MNTVFCDADTSDLADMVGPLMAEWLQQFGGDWDPAEYQDGERVVTIGGIDTDWCISELLPFWAANQEPEWKPSNYHEDCPWQ